MKITLLAIGKTDAEYIRKGIEEYKKRLSKYTNFELKIIPDIKGGKKMPESVQKEKEGELIIGELCNSDMLILLDEKGRNMNSIEFAEFINNNNINSTKKRMLIAIGGPYGFSQKVYDRADAFISLSKMTFSHQMVRMIFIEQLYRAMTIIKGEPYHHQ